MTYKALGLKPVHILFCTKWYFSHFQAVPFFLLCFQGISVEQLSFHNMFLYIAMLIWKIRVHILCIFFRYITIISNQDQKYFAFGILEVHTKNKAGGSTSWDVWSDGLFPNVTADGALPSWGWLSTSLPWEGRNSLLVPFCLAHQIGFYHNPWVFSLVLFWFCPLMSEQFILSLVIGWAWHRNTLKIYIILNCILY